MNFYKGKKVLVTGGTGFCGRHVVQELLDQGVGVRVPIHHRSLVTGDERVTYFAADLTRERDCLELVQGVDYVFHFAGAVGNAGATPTDIMSAISTNLALTSKILYACWKQGVERILLCGSSTVYPAGEHPVKEYKASGWLPRGYLGYGEMHRYIEKLADFVAAESDLKIARVRPTAVYGQWDTSDHVIPSLIRKAVDKEDPFEVWGNGQETRDFLHVTDLARGCLMVLERYAVNDPVNIGYGVSTRIEDVANVILHAAGHQPTIQYMPKPTAIERREVNTEKALSLGFQPEVSLEKGLADTLSWYKETQCVLV